MFSFLTFPFKEQNTTVKKIAVTPPKSQAIFEYFNTISVVKTLFNRASKI